MIKDNSKLIMYLNASISGIFKILPLYEEKNVGVEVYIDSLLFTLYSIDKAIEIQHSHDFITLLATLESIKLEVVKEDSKQPVIKREIFKCINIVKNMVSRLEREL